MPCPSINHASSSIRIAACASISLLWASSLQQREGRAPPLQRQNHPKPRSPSIANRALPIQLPAKLRHAPRHNRQAKSRPLRLGRKKRLQDLFTHTLRNAWPVVFHCKQKSIAVRRASHTYAPATRRRLQSIHHKIRQNLTHRLRASRQFCPACPRLPSQEQCRAARPHDAELLQPLPQPPAHRMSPRPRLRESPAD